MNIGYVAIKKTSQVSREMMASKVTQPKWPHLIMKDKAGTLFVKGSRDVLVIRMHCPTEIFGNR